MERKRLWNNNNIEVVKIDNCWYALDGWNGEKFTDCWETDENTISIDNDTIYEAIPLYSYVDNEEPCEWEIIGYDIRRVI